MVVRYVRGIAHTFIGIHEGIGRHHNLVGTTFLSLLL